jgi:hypothetical protein
MAQVQDPLALELAHEPDPSSDIWQESLVMLWYDDEHGIGGFHRVGHTPNRGTTNTWAGIWTADGPRYRNNAEGLPLSPEDREPPIYRAGVTTFSFDDRLHVRLQDEGVDAELEMEDFHPFEWVWRHGDKTALEAETVPNHLENSGRVRGVVRLGNKEWKVDALAQRDHSWGPRDWAMVPAHRWVVGTCGPELSYSLIVMIGNNGQKMVAGTVTQDGEVRRSTDIDIVTYLDFDGHNGRGGEVVVRFDSGPDVTLRCEAVCGFTFTQDDFGYTETDLLCRVRSGDGRVGFCDFEYSNRRQITDKRVETSLIDIDGLVV